MPQEMMNKLGAANCPVPKELETLEHRLACRLLEQQHPHSNSSLQVLKILARAASSLSTKPICMMNSLQLLAYLRARDFPCQMTVATENCIQHLLQSESPLSPGGRFQQTITTAKV